MVGAMTGDTRDVMYAKLDNRAWRLQWRRWIGRTYQIHTRRVMFPGRYGYQWLYRDMRR